MLYSKTTLCVLQDMNLLIGFGSGHISFQIFFQSINDERKPTIEETDVFHNSNDVEPARVARCLLCISEMRE